MGNAVMTMLIASIVGVISGAIGSLVAPWVHWGIEKKRTKLLTRKAIIDECKRQIDIDGYKEFVSKPCYASIRPFLEKEIIEKVEKGDDHIVVVMGSGRTGGANNFRPILLDEIARIEKEWGLI